MTLGLVPQLGLYVLSSFPLLDHPFLPGLANSAVCTWYSEA